MDCPYLCLSATEYFAVDRHSTFISISLQKSKIARPGWFQDSDCLRLMSLFTHFRPGVSHHTCHFFPVVKNMLLKCCYLFSRSCLGKLSKCKHFTNTYILQGFEQKALQLLHLPVSLGWGCPVETGCSTEWLSILP